MPCRKFMLHQNKTTYSQKETVHFITSLYHYCYMSTRDDINSHKTFTKTVRAATTQAFKKKTAQRRRTPVRTFLIQRCAGLHRQNGQLLFAACGAPCQSDLPFCHGRPLHVDQDLGQLAHVLRERRPALGIYVTAPSAPNHNLVNSDYQTYLLDRRSTFYE